MKKHFLKLEGKTPNALLLAMKGLAFMLFLMVFSQSAFAQSTAKAGNSAHMDVKSPEYATATAIGVTLYDFNSWNRDVVKTTIQQRLNGLNGQSSDPVQMYKYVYYNGILGDISYDIAPELSIIRKVTEERAKLDNNPAITDAIARNIYNDLVNNF